MLVYSSALFLVPAVLALVKSNWLLASLFGVLTGTSVLYHGGVGGEIIQKVDTVYAQLLTIALTSSAFYRAVVDFSAVFAVAGTSGVIAAVIYKAKFPHVGVHVVGAMGFSLYVAGCR